MISLVSNQHPKLSQAACSVFVSLSLCGSNPTKTLTSETAGNTSKLNTLRANYHLQIVNKMKERHKAQTLTIIAIIAPLLS